MWEKKLKDYLWLWTPMNTDPRIWNVYEMKQGERRCLYRLSRYTQFQRINCSGGGDILLLDWLRVLAVLGEPIASPLSPAPTPARIAVLAPWCSAHRHPQALCLGSYLALPQISPSGCPQHSNVMPPPHTASHSTPSFLFSANGKLALCPLPYSRNPTASHNLMLFTGPFISPLAILSPSQLPGASSASAQCLPPSHIYSSGKGPTLRLGWSTDQNIVITAQAHCTPPCINFIYFIFFNVLLIQYLE